ncbi:MAG: DUF4412 domain-containing protein [Pseudomonadota bacterium]
MKLRIHLAALCSLFLLATVCVPASAKTMEELAAEYGFRTDVSYDGTRIMETKDGKFSFKERHAPNKSSMEVNMGGMSGTMIMREDLNKAYFLMPDMGMYREMDVSEASQQSPAGQDLSKLEEVGRETVNGFSARKFKTQFKDSEGKGAGFVWITDEGVPIKMDMIYKSRGMKGQRLTMQLADLKIRRQDPAYFEVPSNLQPMNLGAMLGMAQQMQQETGNSQANQAPPSRTAAGDRNNPTFAEEVGKAAQDESENVVIEETRRSIRDGLRGLFRKATD